MQPGVFSLSGWDLVGALPLSTNQVEYLLGDNDFRWLNRGAVDLMGYNSQAEKSAWGLPRAKVLYGPLPQQLKDPESYGSRLKQILKLRRDYKIELSEVLIVPEVNNPGVFLLVMLLPENNRIAITAINFGRTSASEKIDLTEIKDIDQQRLYGKQVSNALGKKQETTVSEDGSFEVNLDGWKAKLLVIE